MDNVTEISWILDALLWIGLIISSILDIRKKIVSFVPIVLMTAGGLTIHMVMGQMKQPEIWLSFLPGIICILLASLSKGAIGMGDGWMLIGMGALVEYELMITSCVLAMFLASIAAGILFLFFHKGRKYSIPFVPFLAVGCFLGRYLI